MRNETKHLPSHIRGFLFKSVCLPAIPMNTPNPKHAKKAKRTKPNSRLCIEYRRIWTDLDFEYELILKESTIYKYLQPINLPFASIVMIGRGYETTKLAAKVTKLRHLTSCFTERSPNGKTKFRIWVHPHVFTYVNTNYKRPPLLFSVGINDRSATTNVWELIATPSCWLPSSTTERTIDFMIGGALAHHFDVGTFPLPHLQPFTLSYRRFLKMKGWLGTTMLFLLQQR